MVGSNGFSWTNLPILGGSNNFDQWSVKWVSSLVCKK